MRMHGSAGIAVVVLALVGAACGSDGGGGGGPTAIGATTPVERPSSTATVTITRPKNGAVVHGSTVDVEVALDGARIVQQTSTDLKPDEGHLHLLLDGALVSMNYGLDQQIPNVEPGMHLLQVEFVATDHAPFDPRVVAVSSFEVAS